MIFIRIYLWQPAITPNVAYVIGAASATASVIHTQNPNMLTNLDLFFVGRIRTKTRMATKSEEMLLQDMFAGGKLVSKWAVCFVSTGISASVLD